MDFGAESAMRLTLIHNSPGPRTRVTTTIVVELVHAGGRAGLNGTQCVQVPYRGAVCADSVLPGTTNTSQAYTHTHFYFTATCYAILARSAQRAAAGAALDAW